MANKHHPNHQRPGVVLLLALILMAAITASTIGISVLISTTLRQSRALDDFIVASLASDSGLERGLALVKAARVYVVQQSEVLTETTITAAAPFASLDDSDADVTVASAQDNQPISTARLGPNQSITFDLLKTGASPPPNFIKITGECTAGSPCDSVLDVQWVVIDNDGNSSFSGRRVLEELTYETTVVVLDLKQVRTELSEAGAPFVGSGPIGYRVRVRAERGEVSNLQIVACDTSGGCGVCSGNNAYSCTNDATCGALGSGTCNLSSLTAFTSRIRLTSTGEAGALGERVRSVKSAGVLWQLPASPLLQYVIFSEDSLIP